MFGNWLSRHCKSIPFHCYKQCQRSFTCIFFCSHCIIYQMNMKSKCWCTEQYVKYSNVQCQLNLVDLPPWVKGKFSIVLIIIYHSSFPSYMPFFKLSCFLFPLTLHVQEKKNPHKPLVVHFIFLADDNATQEISAHRPLLPTNLEAGWIYNLLLTLPEYWVFNEVLSLTP